MTIAKVRKQIILHMNQKPLSLLSLIILALIFSHSIAAKSLKSEHSLRHHHCKRNFKNLEDSTTSHLNSELSAEKNTKDESPMNSVSTKNSFIAVATKSLQEPVFELAHCKEPQKLTLTGSARTSLKTDLIRIGIQVDTKRPNAQQALQINTQTSNAVTNALINNGVDTTDITTVNFSLTPQYIWVQDPSSGSTNTSIQKFDGYLVSNFIDVKTNKVNLAGKIIDLAVENGAKMINYVNFEILPESMEAAKKMLIKSAVEDALQKAKEVLDPLNYEVSEISEIRLSDISPIYRKFNEEMEVEAKTISGAPSAVVFNNEREVTANIKVVFLIEKKA